MEDLIKNLSDIQLSQYEVALRTLRSICEEQIILLQIEKVERNLE